MSDHDAASDRRRQAEEHLDLLAIFHYVLAGLVAILALVPLIPIASAIVLLTTGDFPPPAPGGHQHPYRLFLLIPVVLGSVAVLLGAILAMMVFMAGRRIHNRHSYTFCVLVAAIECFFFPFGTALGVATLIVLNREEARPLFAGS